MQIAKFLTALGMSTLLAGWGGGVRLHHRSQLVVRQRCVALMVKLGMTTTADIFHPPQKPQLLLDIQLLLVSFAQQTKHFMHASKEKTC